MVSPTAASRWQTVLISTGGLTASISEQSLASLVYCLRFLRVATEHMGSRIADLQALLSNARSPSPSDEENQDANRGMIGPRIEKIKQDIVDMLRKAVDVVSRHAGAALPEPARSRVKMYILSLPSRWAAASTPTKPASGTGGATANGLAREVETGWKVLTLAGESLQMLRGVMTVVADTLQSAEEWAGRLGRNKRSPVTPPESIRDEKDRGNGRDEMNIDE
jgi:transcriptional repressor OPI1